MAKKILITGASSGIGLATTRLLLQQQYEVIATTRDPKSSALQSLRAEYAATLNILEMNVTSTSSVRTLFETLRKEKINLDAVVNNAGYGLAGGLEDITVEEYKAQFETNLFAIHRIIQEVLPLFRAQNSGAIFNLSSMAGEVVFPLFAPYASSKHAVEAYTEGLWQEFRKTNIFVYAIEPGLIETNFYSKGLRFSQKPPSSRSIYKNLYTKYQQNPASVSMGKRSSPDVVAKKILQLLRTPTKQLRHPVGKFARTAIFARTFLPDWIFLPALNMLRRN